MGRSCPFNWSKNEMAKKSITVFNRAHSGYRRAGFVLNKGDNVIERDKLSTVQLKQIADDPRLVLENTEPTTSDDKTDLVGKTSGMVNGQLGAESIDITGDGSGAALPEGTQPPEKLALAVMLMKLLQGENKLEMTGSGKPTTACLEAATEEDVQISATLRNEAWEWLKANPDFFAEKTAEAVDATEATNNEGDA